MIFSISYIIHLKAVSVHLTYSVACHHLKVHGKMPKIIIVELTTSKLKLPQRFAFRCIKTCAAACMPSPYSPWCPCPAAPLVRTPSASVPPLSSSWCWSRPRCRRDFRPARRQWSATRFHRHSSHLEIYPIVYLTFGGHNEPRPMHFSAPGKRGWLNVSRYQ